MNKTITSVILATALTASTVAMAGGVDNQTAAPAASNSGLYVGGDLGYAYSPNGFTKISSAAKSALKTAGVSQDKGGFTFGFHAGYAFDKYVALEAGYMRLPKIGFEDKNTITGTKIKDGFIGHENNNSIYLAVKGSYPVLSNLSVYAKAGYAATFSDSAASVVVSGTTYNVDGTFYDLKSEVSGTIDLLWNIIDNEYRYFIKKDGIH